MFNEIFAGAMGDAFGTAPDSLIKTALPTLPMSPTSGPSQAAGGSSQYWIDGAAAVAAAAAQSWSTGAPPPALAPVPSRAPAQQPHSKIPDSVLLAGGVGVGLFFIWLASRR